MQDDNIATEMITESPFFERERMRQSYVHKHLRTSELIGATWNRFPTSALPQCMSHQMPTLYAKNETWK